MPFARWPGALRLFGRLQRECSASLSVWLGIDCPDRRMDNLVHRLEPLFSDSLLAQPGAAAEPALPGDPLAPGAALLRARFTLVADDAILRDRVAPRTAGGTNWPVTRISKPWGQRWTTSANLMAAGDVARESDCDGPALRDDYAEQRLSKNPVFMQLNPDNCRSSRCVIVVFSCSRLARDPHPLMLAIPRQVPNDQIAALVNHPETVIISSQGKH